MEFKLAEIILVIKHDVKKNTLSVKISTLSAFQILVLKGHKIQPSENRIDRQRKLSNVNPIYP